MMADKVKLSSILCQRIKIAKFLGTTIVETINTEYTAIVDDNNLQKRLKKDINTINSVGSILVEPLNVNRSRSWVSYCLKGKQI
jgi:hypothetical protein